MLIRLYCLYLDDSLNINWFFTHMTLPLAIASEIKLIYLFIIYASSANNTWFISTSHQLHSAMPALSQVPVHSPLAPHNYLGDITQPCLNPTLTGNHSLTSILTRTHVLLYTYTKGAYNIKIDYLNIIVSKVQ